MRERADSTPTLQKEVLGSGETPRNAAKISITLPSGNRVPLKRMSNARCRRTKDCNEKWEEPCAGRRDLSLGHLGAPYLGTLPGAHMPPRSAGANPWT